MVETSIDMLELSEKMIRKEWASMMDNTTAWGIADQKRMERYAAVLKELDEFE